MENPNAFFAALVFVFGVGMGVSISHTDSAPDLEERKAVLECMSEVGWDAADPAATREEQLYQSQRWCEQFLDGPDPTRASAI